jgi:hypothetical protein
MTTNTNQRIAEFRKSLLDYDNMLHAARTPSPEPEAPISTFVADPNSPHLPLSSNVTTRNRNHRRFSDMFTLSHRGRHGRNLFSIDNNKNNQKPRPKISRPIVNQGAINVPHNGPYIYNHPDRPQYTINVEIPRSSFSDLWGQRYGTVGETGYDIDPDLPDAYSHVDFSSVREGTLMSEQRGGSEGDSAESTQGADDMDSSSFPVRLASSSTHDSTVSLATTLVSVGHGSTRPTSTMEVDQVQRSEEPDGHAEEDNQALGGAERDLSPRWVRFFQHEEEEDVELTKHQLTVTPPTPPTPNLLITPSLFNPLAKTTATTTICPCHTCNSRYSNLSAPL